MKKLFTIILLLISITGIKAQSASDYFPSAPGHMWYFKISPLDSLNNEIEELTLYRIDSFAVAADYMGRNANVILTKAATYNTVQFVPYIDSEYVSLEGNIGYEYLTFRGIDLAFLDSLNVDFNLTEALKGWYPVYQFAQAINDPYQIFSKDTTVSIDGSEFPLRLQYFGNRFEDETLVTNAGSYTTKKFNLTFSISYLFSFIPGFPPIAVPLVNIDDTVWVAEDNWVVKSFIPSTNVDLTQLGFGSYFIPGSNRETIPPISVTGINEDNLSPTEFVLNQNYPNPFNPETKINFTIPSQGDVKLKILNILGKEIVTLVDKNVEKGTYSINFNGDEYSLSSGVYFYRIEYSGKAVTKKMILMK